MCEVSKGLGATPLRLAGGGTDPNLSGQSLVKCIKSFMLCTHLRIYPKEVVMYLLPGFLYQDVCLHPHLQLWGSVQLIKVHLT